MHYLTQHQLSLDHNIWVLLAECYLLWTLLLKIPQDCSWEMWVAEHPFLHIFVFIFSLPLLPFPPCKCFPAAELLFITNRALVKSKIDIDFPNGESPHQCPAEQPNSVSWNCVSQGEEPIRYLFLARELFLTCIPPPPCLVNSVV